MSLLPDFASFYNVPAPDYRRARFYREQTFTVHPYPLGAIPEWKFTRLDWPALMLRQHDVFDVRVRIRIAPYPNPETQSAFYPQVIAALSSPNLGILSQGNYSALYASSTYGTNKGEQRSDALAATFDGFIQAWEVIQGSGLGEADNGIVLSGTARFEGCTKASAWPSLYVFIPSYDAKGDPFGPLPPLTFSAEWSVVSTRSTWAENAAAENEGDWENGNLIQSTMDQLGWLCDLGADPAQGQYRPEQVDALTGAATLTDLSSFWSVYDSSSDF
jgi:hypothetical protein